MPSRRTMRRGASEPCSSCSGCCWWQLLVAAAAPLAVAPSPWPELACHVSACGRPASQAQPCSVSSKLVACAAALLPGCGRHEASQLQLSGQVAICDADANQICSRPCIRMDAWWEPASGASCTEVPSGRVHLRLGQVWVSQLCDSRVVHSWFHCSDCHFQAEGG